MIAGPDRCGIGSGAQPACGFPEARSGCATDASARPARSDWCMSDSVVVVGNGVSGYACAARLAERGVPVTMIGPGLPHDRPPLSKRALSDRSRAAARRRGAARRARHRARRRRRDRMRPRPPSPRRRPLGRRSAARDRGADARLGDRSALPEAARPRLRAGRGEHHRRRSRLARPAPDRAAQARRRGRRRADRHRDRRDDRGRARRDARRHARPPAGALPPARVRRRPRRARPSRRALPRLVQDRLREHRRRRRRRAHVDPRRPSLRRRRLGGRLPLEPPARARRPRRESAHPPGRRAAARDRPRAPLGVRRLRLVPAPALGPHRHPALGSRALERPPRGRVDSRLDRALRARAVLLQRHRPSPHPAGRRRRRGRRLARRRRARRRSRPGRRARVRAPAQRAGAPARGSRARRVRRLSDYRQHPSPEEAPPCSYT